MKKKKKEKAGPSGMVKRCLGKGKSGPVKPPPAIGDIVYYYKERGGWRTGRLLRVIDRGKSWGRLEVRDSVSKQKTTARPEDVRSL